MAAHISYTEVRGFCEIIRILDPTDTEAGGKGGFFARHTDPQVGRGGGCPATRDGIALCVRGVTLGLSGVILLLT